MTSDQKLNFIKSENDLCILIGATGSVASIKVPQIVEKLSQLKIPVKDVIPERQRSIHVRVIATEHAKHFFNPKDLSVLVYEDSDEWACWKGRSDPVLHIELRKWADVLVIAPLDANTLSKLANGLCDNLLTCVVRAWDLGKPLFFAPAMNTYMWEHPLTSRHINSLCEFGFKEIPCIEKVLMCGEKGLGAMAETDTIVESVASLFCA